MRKYDLIIKAGILISMAENQELVNNVYIMISNGEIKDINNNWEKEIINAREYINAEDCIVMPGLINCHTHLPMTLLRGISDDLPLNKWLFEKIFPWESKHMNPDTVYWGSLLGCAELIRAGTTCIVDGYFFQESTIKALDEAKIRGLIAQGIIDFPSPDIPDPKENINIAKAFLEKWTGYSDLIIPGIFCHSPYTCSEKTLKSAKRLSEQFGIPLQIHLSETLQEVKDIFTKTGKKPVIYLNDIGILDKNLITAHAIHLDDDEIDILAEKEVKIAHVPESNMKLASGIAPISKFIEKGLTIGIGTDGCASNNNLNLLCEIESASKLAKVAIANPACLDSYTALKMVTTWGAKLLGCEDKIGSIEIGKKADLIILDTDKPYMHPLYDPMASVVYSSSGGNVRDVIVNGKIVMRNRKLQTLQLKDILYNIKCITKKLNN